MVNEIYSRNPRDKCATVNQIASAVLRPAGCAITDRDFKHTWLTWKMALLIVDVLSFALYATYYYRHQFMLALQAMITLGVSVPVSND